MADADRERLGGAADLPLAGLRVIDCAAGALAGTARLLGELGADVTRVQPEHGAGGRVIDGVDIDAAVQDLGKRVVAVDRAGLEALVRDADVLIETCEPGSGEAAALDVPALRRANPALVVVSITGFGQVGPWAGWRATDPVLHALTGGLARSGLPDRAPLLPPGELTLHCAAAQAAYLALVAFVQRMRTGRGDRVDVALVEAGMAALDPGFGIAGSAQSGVPLWKMARGRMDERRRYPIFACADGFARVCVMAPRQWAGMFAWMGEPAAFADPAFATIQARNRSAELHDAIAAFLAPMTRAEIEAGAVAHGVPAAAVLSLDEAIATDQVRARAAIALVALAPGVTARVPDGMLVIDGVRAGPRGGVASPAAWPVLPEAARPLEGVKVLDLGVIVVGAETGRLLADMGADVVKVEHASNPDGQRQSRDDAPVSITFAAGHRNKRGLSLDLRSAAGKARFLALVGEADVLLSNFKPGTLAKLGFDAATLAAANPRLVTVDSSAFGATGPWSGRLGYGPLVRCAAGLTARWTYDGEPESFSDGFTVYPDHVAARVGTVGALALLIRRWRTGQGGNASVAQAEVMLAHMAADIAAASLGQPIDAPRDAPWGLFACAGDDEWCAVTIEGDADWRALAGVVPGLDAAWTRGERVAARGAIDAALGAWTATRAPADVMATLQGAGVPAGMMLRVVELPGQPQFQALGTFRAATHPLIGQAVHVEAAPARSETLPAPDQRPAPRIGEHSRAVLRDWLELDPDTIAALERDGVTDQPA